MVMNASLPRFKFKVEEYYQMLEDGYLGEQDRVELIDGELIAMSPKSVRHNHLVNRLTRLLAKQLDELYIVAVENTIRLSDTNAPEPDVAILDLETDGRDTLPFPADIYLIAEVCITSLDYDRNVKVPRYAKAGIPEVWVINLEENVVEQYTQPTAQGYRQITLYRDGDTLTARHLPLTIDIATLLKK
jgi:Uma2 family endonuclease